MVSKTITVNGIYTRWEEQGEGTPLVLVHGVPTSPLLWRHVVPRIQGARCLAWEMVGYGDSIPQGRGRSIAVARQADYLLAWMDALGIRRAVLAGHDLGGGVIQNVAAREPSRCAGLFLTNSIGYDSWPVPEVRALRGMGSLVRRLPDALVKLVFRVFYARGHNDPGRATEAMATHWPFYARHGAGAALVRQARSLHTWDTVGLASRLRELNVPARVVWGAADNFQPVEYGERFARDLRAPLRRIDGGKHFTPEDHPDVVAGEINQLLTQTRAPQRESEPAAGAASVR